VRNWIKAGAILLEADSAPWTVAAAERPEDIPLVLEVVNLYRHPTWWITVATGRWIARLRRAFPGLQAIHILDLARRAVRDDALTFMPAGLPSQRFHDLRHAAATLLLEQGEELAVVSRILGHASITTTADIYGHMTDAMSKRAADRTDAILGTKAVANG
jgi:integrase